MAGVRENMVKRNADGTRGWLSIKGLPRLRFCIKRPLPDGKLKGILITRKPTGWYVSLQYAVVREPLPELEGAVGVDMGVRKRLALSTEETVPPRLIDLTREDELRRKVARSKKGSNNRRKRVATLGRETYRNAMRRLLGLRLVLRRGTAARLQAISLVTFSTVARTLLATAPWQQAESGPTKGSAAPPPCGPTDARRPKAG